jgi:hypothetical protein
MSIEALMRWQRIESIVGGFDLRPCGFEAEMAQEVAREGLPPSFAEGAVEEFAIVLLILLSVAVTREKRRNVEQVHRPRTSSSC